MMLTKNIGTGWNHQPRWVDLLVSRSLMIKPNTLYYITIHYVDLENFSGILWWAQVPLPHVLDDQTVVLVFSLLHPWQHPEIVKQWFQHPYTVRLHHGSSSGILSIQFTALIFLTTGLGVNSGHLFVKPSGMVNISIVWCWLHSFYFLAYFCWFHIPSFAG